jgi:peptidyl-prolyl cis-trans isomerase C
MFKSENLAVLLILGALAANPAFGETKPAALVNGVAIPQARVDMRVKAAAAQGQADSPELRKSIREDLINLEVMAQEATRLGVAKKPEVMQQIELARQSVLAGNYMQDYVKSNPITEDQIKQEYEKLKSRLGDKEYNARHILVETEAEAKAIIAKLDKKAKFDKLATEKSKDSGSAARGGSLDWASPGSYVPPFANALKNLKKGEYTKSPVQSQFGWHVIKLEDVRDLKAPAYDEVKPQLQQRLQQQLVQKVIADLKAKAKIE